MLKDLHNRLRPMEISDILDETIEIYKKNFVLLVGIAAFLYVPIFLFQFILNNNVPFSITDSSMSQRQFIYSCSLYILFGIFYMLGSLIVTGALTYAISEKFLGRETSIAACYKRIANKKVFFPFLGLNLMIGLITIAAVALPIIPIASGAVMIGAASGNTGLILGGALIICLGVALFAVPIYVILRLTIAAPTLIIEMPGVFPAINRSWKLIKGNILKAFAILLIINLVVSILSAIIVSPLTLISAPAALKGGEPSSIVMIITALLSTITSTIFAPISSIAVILLYYDARIRKEGFDLEMLARELDEKTREFNAYGVSSLPQEQINTAHYTETPSANEPPQEQ